MIAQKASFEVVELRRLALPECSQIKGDIVTVGRVFDRPGQIFDPNEGVPKPSFLVRTSYADYYGHPAQTLRNPKTRTIITAGVIINLSRLKGGETDFNELIVQTTGEFIEPLLIGDIDRWSNKGVIWSVTGIYPEDLLIATPDNNVNLRNQDMVRSAEQAMGQFHMGKRLWGLGHRCLQIILDQYESQTC